AVDRVQQARDGARRAARDAVPGPRTLPGAGTRPRRARGAPARARSPAGCGAPGAAGHRAHAGHVPADERSLRPRLLALVLPDPAAAATRSADRVRPGALR